MYVVCSIHTSYRQIMYFISYVCMYNMKCVQRLLEYHVQQCVVCVLYWAYATITHTYIRMFLY